MNRRKSCEKLNLRKSSRELIIIIACSLSLKQELRDQIIKKKEVEGGRLAARTKSQYHLCPMTRVAYRVVMKVQWGHQTALLRETPRQMRTTTGRKSGYKRKLTANKC